MKEQISFKQYRRKQIAELADWVQGMDMTGVSISEADLANGSPKQGDKIARNPKNHNDKWLVAADYFADNFEALFPQGDKIDGNALPSAAYDEYFTPPQSEGGLLSDEEICKTACGEYAGKCPARKLNHGCSDFVDIMAVITKQHSLDQQHEANALKEQMERVMDKLPEVARQQISQKHSLWFDDVDSTEIDELVDAIVEALKAELEGENG